VHATAFRWWRKLGGTAASTNAGLTGLVNSIVLGKIVALEEFPDFWRSCERVEAANFFAVLERSDCGLSAPRPIWSGDSPLDHGPQFSG